MESTVATTRHELRSDAAEGAVAWARPTIALIGRILFGIIFFTALPNHFKAGTIAYAASAGVPFAGILVPASGILAFLGATSVALGYRAKLGAWLLVAFLVPVTLAMHAFWNVADPGMRGIQYIMFLKNVSMLGAALLLTQVGSGPLSLDGGRESGGRN
ncbi:MAG: DoxX family protein [Hyphomicrobiales bacterium]